MKWAGVYWQQPPKNWGEDAKWQGRGYDLSLYKRLTFWARSQKKCEIKFKVGGIGGAYGDSLRPAKEIRAKLKQDWQWYEINLMGGNLKHIIGGFCWTTDWDSNPEGITFYLDDIRFEKN